MQVCLTRRITPPPPGVPKSGKKRVKRIVTTREKPAKVSKTCYRYGDVEKLFRSTGTVYLFLRERGLLHNSSPSCPYCMTGNFKLVDAKDEDNIFNL